MPMAVSDHRPRTTDHGPQKVAHVVDNGLPIAAHSSCVYFLSCCGLWSVVRRLYKQKTARPITQSGGCRFAFDVVFASSNVSDQTGCLGGGGGLGVQERRIQHERNITANRGIVNHRPRLYKHTPLMQLYLERVQILRPIEPRASYGWGRYDTIS